MKPKVYIETSVLSYLAARPSLDPVTAGRQVITRRWWDSEREKYRGARCGTYRIGGSGGVRIFDDVELPPYRECADSASNREDSSESWLHENNYLHARRAHLNHHSGKTKCCEKFIPLVMRTRRNTVMIWTAYMQTSSDGKHEAAYPG